MGQTCFQMQGTTPVQLLVHILHFQCRASVHQHYLWQQIFRFPEMRDIHNWMRPIQVQLWVTWSLNLLAMEPDLAYLASLHEEIQPKIRFLK